MIATEFLGHDVLLTIDPAGDAAPIIVRQHSLNPPPIDAKVRIEVVGSGVVLTVSRLLDHLRGHGERVAVLTDTQQLTYRELADRVADAARELGGPSPPGAARNPQRLGHFGALPGGDGGRPRGAAGSGRTRPHRDAADLRTRRRRSTPTASTIVTAADATGCTTTSRCCCRPRAAPAHPNWCGCRTRNLVANAAAIAEYLDIRETDRAATTLPMSYCYGLSVIHSHLLRGAGLILTDHSVVDDEFWELFRRHRGTAFAGVPYTFELLERVGFDRPWTCPHLRYVTQAGGRMPPERVRRFAELGATQGWDLFVMYGATEATARMAYLPPELASSHPAAIGRPIPGGVVHDRTASTSGATTTSASWSTAAPT